MSEKKLENSKSNLRRQRITLLKEKVISFVDVTIIPFRSPNYAINENRFFPNTYSEEQIKLFRTFEWLRLAGLLISTVTGHPFAGSLGYLLIGALEAANLRRVADENYRTRL